MERRFLLFIVLSVAILGINIWIQGLLAEKKEPAKVAQKANPEAKKDKPKDDGKKAENPGKKDEPKAPEPELSSPAESEEPLTWFTLGSADTSNDNPDPFLVMFTSFGAAVERIELSTDEFRDAENRGGYLGSLAPQDVPQGVQINVVGPGTPAQIAGLRGPLYKSNNGRLQRDADGKPVLEHEGDIITAIDDQTVKSTAGLFEILSKSRPGQSVDVTYLRDGKTYTTKVALIRQPQAIVRPEVLPPNANIPRALPTIVPGEGHDPLSFLFTLWQIDEEKLSAQKDGGAVNAELPGVQLRSTNWHGEKLDDRTVEFTKELPKFGLKFVKRFRLPKPEENLPKYQLKLELEIHNLGREARKVAYQLDGPTGLPLEGWWYNSRISREGAIGVRDAVLLLQGHDPAQISPMRLGEGDLDPPFRSEQPDLLMAFAAVDAQYFACALIPDPFQDREPWLAQIKGILVGELPKQNAFQILGDVSCRLVSVEHKLEPEGAPLKHTYTIFAGPKRPALLSQFGNPKTNDNLGQLIYYGWPIWAMVAKPMTKILHFFYDIVGNYGIAIILLTVVVRACLFPFSRKQALAAQKMQELKPEMDKINEKYKGKPEEKTRAMQELWRKHNYNPLSGCLLVFLQLPIFIGLYRALMIDVELWQAPLISQTFPWCSNLAAPDMLAYWRAWPFMPEMITAYKGFGSLGPYLNILPLITVGLFLWQQKMFMPPATDDNSRMQQKMMKYMMVLIGFMFFTVPSGLCIYFIASSLWGIAERKLLPKTLPTGANGGTGVANRATADVTATNGAAARRERRKQRERGK